jgi:hypothetical protein
MMLLRWFMTDPAPVSALNNLAGLVRRVLLCHPLCCAMVVMCCAVCCVLCVYVYVHPHRLAYQVASLALMNGLRHTVKEEELRLDLFEVFQRGFSLSVSRAQHSSLKQLKPQKQRKNKKQNKAAHKRRRPTKWACVCWLVRVIIQVLRC